MPPGAASVASRRFVLGAVMAMMFMIAIEGTIVATAMPTIVGALGNFDLFSWVFTAYLLTQAVTIPIYGRLADFYGRRPVLFVGMGVFLTASLLCGLAWGMVPLIVFRALQGVGAGALMPVGMTIVADLYPPAERARVQAYVSSVWVIAALIAPLMGAFFVAHWIWATVFWVNLPLGAVATAMLAWALKEVHARHARRIDYVGSVLMVVGSGALMFVLVQATKLSLATILGVGGVAVAILAVLLAYEFRIREPMLPLALWRDPIVVGGNLANLLHRRDADGRDRVPAALRAGRHGTKRARRGLHADGDVGKLAHRKRHRGPGDAAHVLPHLGLCGRDPRAGRQRASGHDLARAQHRVRRRRGLSHRVRHGARQQQLSGRRAVDRGAVRPRRRDLVDRVHAHGRAVARHRRVRRHRQRGAGRADRGRRRHRRPHAHPVVPRVSGAGRARGAHAGARQPRCTTSS